MVYKQNNQTNILHESNRESWASALDVSPVVSIPLVYCKDTTNGMTTYHGFVPGLKLKDVICSDLDECHTQNSKKVKNEILELIKTKQPIPFFPTDEDIKESFENVCAIKRIILDTTKKSK